MNAGIQGLAADIFKVALVRIHQALSDAHGSSRLILQVHDEVLIEVPEAERESVGPLVIDIMRHAAELDVPLEVNVSWGQSWASAKGLVGERARRGKRQRRAARAEEPKRSGGERGH